MDWITKHLADIWSILVSFLAGGTVGSLVTIRFVRNRSSGTGTIIDQTKARAGGDIVAGSKITKR